MTTYTINEPTSGMATQLADGGYAVTLVYPPCPVCQHTTKPSGCYHCKAAAQGGICLACVYRDVTPVGTDVPPVDPPPGPIVPPVMP